MKRPKQLQTHLPMMWKILTAKIKEEIYKSLISRRLFSEEQKGCLKRTRGTGELLYIDQQILNECKTRRKNLTLAWIDYKKAYYIVPPNWIVHCLKMYKIPDEVIKFMENGIDSKRKKLSRSKDPKRHIPGRCTVTITLCNSDDATPSHSQEMQSRIQTQ